MKRIKAIFFEDNYFCQAIYKYTLTIANQKMKVLVVHKILRLLISKANMETMGKFDTLYIS